VKAGAPSSPGTTPPLEAVRWAAGPGREGRCVLDI
jgi:hypothetical protein